MEVNDNLIEKLATLSRLEFDGDGKKAIKQDLQNMIAFVEKLNALDTSGVAPVLHMSKNVNVLRADKVKGSVDREIALKNASNSDGIYFKVPKVISKNSNT